MEIHWENTNSYYHEMLSATSNDARKDIFRERFLKPWQQMMDMVSRGQSDDEFAGPKNWNWLLPENFEETPSSLTILEKNHAWEIGETALKKAVDIMQPYSDKISFDSVSGWLILANPETSDPTGRGYTGACDFMQPRFVVQYDAPNAYNIPRLAGAVVHEFNHLVRLGVFPWDMMKTSVADYIIHEGLAESFAGELYGEKVLGHYVTEFNEEQLKKAKVLINEALEQTGFNVIRGYIFGDELAEKWGFDKVGMPTFGGYAIGYRVVQAYLKRTGKTATEATFISAMEIIQESGFFNK